MPAHQTTKRSSVQQAPPRRLRRGEVKKQAAEWALVINSDVYLLLTGKRRMAYNDWRPHASACYMYTARDVSTPSAFLLELQVLFDRSLDKRLERKLTKRVRWWLENRTELPYTVRFERRHNNHGCLAFYPKAQ